LEGTFSTHRGQKSQRALSEPKTEGGRKSRVREKSSRGQGPAQKERCFWQGSEQKRRA